MDAKIKRIPGLMTEDELALLCRMARSAQSIVELGTYKGRSLAAMMLTNPKAKAWGVDSFGDMSHRGYKGSTEAETKANLVKLGLKPEIIAATSTEAAQQFEGKIDLLHIDAGHSYEEVKADIKNWLPKVNKGGVLCFHDYGIPKNKKLDRPEVKQAVDEWRNDKWAEVERAGVMIAFRSMIADEGALYVAYGERARKGAQASAQSLREKAPGLPIAVVTDRTLEGFDHCVIEVQADPGARTQKTRIYSLSPFKKTFYLDADTRVLSSPKPGFNLLNYVDVVLTQDPNVIFSHCNWSALDPAEVAATKQELGTDEFLYWNSGVIFFRRNERNRALFQEWHHQWQRWHKHDQMALLRATHLQPVRIAPMRAPWNTHKKDVAKFVFHMHRTVSQEGAPK
jgi:predicted O-methyltransferase YrrM